MNIHSIKARFQKLTLWKRGGERAPHKPLLSLFALGRLQSGKPERFIPFSEIDREVGRLLREFGPDRKSYHPEYPFWRLQRDGIWEVTQKDQLPVNRSGGVNKSHLVRNDVRGGFNPEVYHALQTDPQLFREVVQTLLDANFPATLHEEILQAVGIDLGEPSPAKKRRDPEFRERVLRAYEYRCAICGFDIRLDLTPIALEAAHIKWHHAGGPDIETNGLALCTLHHKLFDRGAFTLSPELEIMVSDRAHGSQGFDQWLLRFHGHQIQPPQRVSYLPDQSFRNWHVREVFKGGFRE